MLGMAGAEHATARAAPRPSSKIYMLLCIPGVQACMKAVSSWEIQILQATVTGTDLTLAAWGLCLQGSR